MIVQRKITMQQMKVPITEILKSNIRDYILVTGDITVVTPPATQVPFKNSAPFTKCITKTDERTMYDAEDLDLVMSMYNLVILKQQEFYSLIHKTKQLMLMQILLMIFILSLSKIRLNY